MKTKLLALSCAIATILLAASCKKSEETTTTHPPAESAPVNTLYTKNLATSFYLVYYTTITFEMGFKFNATRPGKITKLGVKMWNAGTYRITLWDASAGTPAILAQSDIVQAADSTLIFSSLASPVTISTGKDYVVSLWADTYTKYYVYKPAGGGNFSYPMTQGSIIFKSFVYTDAPFTPAKCPSFTDNTAVGGIADFEFQPD